MDYSATLEWLFGQFPAYHQLGAAAYNPGLKNTNELAAFFGNPQDKLRFIHVGGTNGKGSTCNMLASILTESGEKVGLFTSPHLFHFTERIRVNGIPIEPPFVIDFCAKIRDAQWTIAPSFFEITWVMALAYFEQQQCSIVLAEVGLGGRLDATNIIHPLLSIITNIGLDHVNLLGETRTLIAGEKAGIIKSGVPFIIGENDSEIAAVFEQKSNEVGARQIALSPVRVIPPTLLGYQQLNYRVVQTACDYLQTIGFSLSEEIILRGIERIPVNTGFMGRMMHVGTEPTIILDCAHNAEGIRAFLDAVLPISEELHIVYGTSSDKDMASIARLLPENAHYYFTEFNNPRSAKMSDLETIFKNFGKKSVFFQDSNKALKAAQNSANKRDTILIFGSFFLIHDFFEVFFKETLAEKK